MKKFCKKELLNHLLTNLFLLTTVILILGATACTSSSEPDSSAVQNAFAEEIQEVLGYSSSDFTKGILADSFVTDEEFSGAKERFSECMIELGQVVEFTGDATLFVSRAVEGPGQNSATSEGLSKCTADFATIGHYYYEMRTNPSHASIEAQMVKCLKRHNLVPDEFTEADYTREISSDGDSGGIMRQISATGSDESKEAFQNCFIAPGQ